MNRKFQDLTKDHIDSFNNFLTTGIKTVPKYIRPITFKVDETDTLTVAITDINVLDPVLKNSQKIVKPWECRRLEETYCAPVELTVEAKFNNSPKTTVKQICGTIPIMIGSKKCILYGKSKEELVALNEEPDESGGYFIINGLQYLLRYLIQSRRNFPITLYKSTDAKDTRYTGDVCMIRCTREDEVVAEMKLKWKRSECPDLVIQIDKKIYSLPLIIVLMALQNKTPGQIIKDLHMSDQYRYVQNLSSLVNGIDTNLNIQSGCLDWIGLHFRVKYVVDDSVTNEEIGRYVIEDYIAINLHDYKDKYNLLLHMYHKLALFNIGCGVEESNDTLNFQELLTGGSLYQQVFRLILVNQLNMMPIIVKSMLEKKPIRNVSDILRKSFFSNKNLFSPMHTLLSTGSIFNNKIIPGLKQNNALSIVLDNINTYRFIANFRSFHRGKFFQDSKDNTVRKLLPEAWGFVCPVHTPDGHLCGILNHLSINATVVSEFSDQNEEQNLEEFLRNFVISDEISTDCLLPCMLNSKMLGYIDERTAKQLEMCLRSLKATRDSPVIPMYTEIVCILNGEEYSQYPGFYVFTNTSRIMRPVINKFCGLIEYIGTLEQCYLNIQSATEKNSELFDKEDEDFMYTHSELSRESNFSFTASFSPYSNHNPSPRNIYQCQMSKQSMGFTYFNMKYRGDHKMYSFRNPQIPLVRNNTYDEYGMSMRPVGYNPVVAITSFTGYDMEDAMVINRCSLQRGLANCCIYKNILFDYRTRDGEDGEEIIWCGEGHGYDNLDIDGTPAIDSKIMPNSPLACKYNTITGARKLELYNGTEPAYVKEISRNGSHCFVTITLRINRDTVIGDKFASRHGQKGVNSLQVHEADLPYNWDGMVPDQLFNPHGMPTRMTMGKLIEICAGKLAAVEGRAIDSTPFQDESEIAKYYDRLEANGYDRFGGEFMFSPNRAGQMMQNMITMGIVYYQRLRHMVNDKFQVRAGVGPVDMRTRQPVKGRKLGGGIRLGEMERDALLSHGAVNILHERMLESSSDKISVMYCHNCQSFIHVTFVPQDPKYVTPASKKLIDSKESNNNQWKCVLCEDGSDTKKERMMQKVEVPAITRYFMHKMIPMGFRFVLGIENYEEEPEPMEDDDEEIDENELYI